MIWPTYTAMLAILYVVLSIRTLRLRRRLRVAVGDGGSISLLRAVRVHGNFAEYVPLGLLLMAGCERLGAPALLIHALGWSLVVGRLVHALGVSRESEVYAFRVSGMALTLACYSVAIGYLLFRAGAGSN